MRFEYSTQNLVNFLVGGIELANIVEIMRNFTPSGQPANGPYVAGTLGNLKVFINPDFPSNEFVLGFKGTNMFQAGAFYCPYMPVSSRLMWSTSK